MAYVIPQMPLLCAVWTGGADPTATPPREEDIPCNLGQGNRVLSSGLFATGENYPAFASQLLLPAFTDIRGYQNGYLADLVEVPQGTGRYYYVWQVDDIGKGFANEHRFAMITPFALYGGWSTPYA